MSLMHFVEVVLAHKTNCQFQYLLAKVLSNERLAATWEQFQEPIVRVR